MDTWIARDPEASWEHLKGLNRSNLHYSLHGFAHILGVAQSNSPDWDWVARELSEMTSADQIKLLKETGGTSERALSSQLPDGFADPSEKQRFRINFLQALVDEGRPETIHSHMQDVPWEKRPEIISGLRGIDEEGLEKIGKIMS